MTFSVKNALLCATVLAGSVSAANSAPLVTGSVDERALVSVAGERSPLLDRAQDTGAVADDLVLTHVMLILKRSAVQQAALDKLVRDQLDAKSPSFHKWLAPADLRAFGPAAEDVAATVKWLQSHGLTINRVSPAGMSVDFGGRVADIDGAFHTSLHNVSLDGEMHIANMTDLAIPAALAPVVRGATLSNFFPKPNAIKASPLFTVPSNPAYYAVAPADFATIYDLNPLFTGQIRLGRRSPAPA